MLRCFALGVLMIGLLLNGSADAGEEQRIRRTEDVIYGRKHGMALTFDVFQPAKPNGIRQGNDQPTSFQ